MRAQIQLLPDGRRLYLHDGPIDVILEAFGRPEAIQSAYRSATQRFVCVLDELCRELALLRQPYSANAPQPTGEIARRMAGAVAPYADWTFITPMAAVAGAVAEEILRTMILVADLERAYVNDGGDIAIFLAPGEQFAVGMVERPDRPSLFGTAILDSSGPVRGIATSGWRGRSFSLGIADAVTVLGASASAADAAATIIANAVDLPCHPNIQRIPACELAPDSDLGDILVTRDVGNLERVDIIAALDNGEAMAKKLLEKKLICAAALHLRGETRVIDTSSGAERPHSSNGHWSLVNA